MSAWSDPPPTAPSTPSPPAVDLLVDWELAARTAALVGRPGPETDESQVRDLVSDLRSAAARATPHVERVTGLRAESAEEVLVVDRAGWTRANIDAFRGLLGPVVAAALARRHRQPGPVLAAVGGKVTGAEVGSLLAFLSGKVLGQYDAFYGLDPAADLDASPSTGPARLLLVAPNVMQVERELKVDPADFRLWVCLHEETHRVQFGANPWLRAHLVDQARSLVGDLLIDPAQALERFGQAVRDLPELIRGRDSGDRPGFGLVDLIQAPEQRRRLQGLTAVMSLLEGHADVVMDDVGPAVVPSVGVIRERFGRRRAGQGALDQLMRRLLGLDAKMRQYADGARFVRAVIERVGMSGFNAVWAGPDTLPTPEEIADASLWVARVHG